MKILFLVERPTQFEAPFFRHVAERHPEHTLRVLFTAAAPTAPVYDPELEHEVDFGADLLGSGYPHAKLPAVRRRRWLDSELRRESWDLFITNGYQGRDDLAAARLARRAGVATALRLDSVADGSRARLAAKHLLFTAVLGRFYDLFLGVGSRTMEYLDRCGIEEARRGRFQYAVDVEHFRAASSLSPEARAAERRRRGVAAGAATAASFVGAAPGAATPRVVLAVSKMSDREAPWDLIEALPRLRAGAAPPELVMAGDGPALARLRERAEALAPGRVHFTGYLDYAELPALYAAADLFVHTAHREHWGVSVAEALACGLPVIVSSGVGAGADLIAPGRNGFVYPAGDVAALARCIDEALSPGFRDTAGVNRQILARWDYAASWQDLLAAAERARTLARGRRR